MAFFCKIYFEKKVINSKMFYRFVKQLSNQLKTKNMKKDYINLILIALWILAGLTVTATIVFLLIKLIIKLW